MIEEMKIVTHETMDSNQIREIEDKFRTILKALDLLSCDLFEDITDSMNDKYFHSRIDYIYGVAIKRDISLITPSYLRSLYALFNNYYQAYQCPSLGDTISHSDKERYFIYSEINSRLEEFRSEY